jgi:hypothetical protein
MNPVTLKPLVMPSCSTCLYCRSDRDLESTAKLQNLKAPDQGICVRFPPTSQLVGTPQGAVAMMVKTVIPLDHWCGEFKDCMASG